MSDIEIDHENADVPASRVAWPIAGSLAVAGVVALILHSCIAETLEEKPAGPASFPEPQLTTMPPHLVPMPAEPPASIRAAMKAIAARGDAAYDPITGTEAQ